MLVYKNMNVEYGIWIRVCVRGISSFIAKAYLANVMALSLCTFHHQTLNADDEGSMFGSLLDHPYMPVYTERLYVEAIKAGSDRISALHPHCAGSTLTS